MNQQIVRLTYVSLALVGVLVVDDDLLADLGGARARRTAGQRDQARRRVLGRPRPDLLDDAAQAARAEPSSARSTAETLFFRRYPQGSLAAHVVGYSTVGRSRTGLERSLNDYLTGSNANLSTLVDKALDELRGKPVQGNDVVHEPRPRRAAGRARGARDALRRRRRARSAERGGPRDGLVAELRPEPRRGELRRDLAHHGRLRAGCPARQPRERRASSFPARRSRSITAAAALESRKFTPESTFVDPGYCTVYGKRVNNFDTSQPFRDDRPRGTRSRTR